MEEGQKNKISFVRGETQGRKAGQENKINMVRKTITKGGRTKNKSSMIQATTIQEGRSEK